MLKKEGPTCEVGPVRDDPAEHLDQLKYNHPSRKKQETWRPLGDIVNSVVMQRAAERLHALGARAVLEAMIEVARGSNLDAVLENYARLDPAVVRELGADRFPVSIFAVPK